MKSLVLKLVAAVTFLAAFIFGAIVGGELAEWLIQRYGVPPSEQNHLVYSGIMAGAVVSSVSAFLLSFAFQAVSGNRPGRRYDE
ncbi:MAG: hypothetical protein AAF664_06425 [Planctomycetota bacterium]